MPFQWNININRALGRTPPVKFDPNPLPNVAPGDQVVWVNNDSASAHWPGLKNADGSIDKTFFMANQIAPSSTSTTFVPSAAGTFNYVCSLHPQETGSIQVG